MTTVNRAKAHTLEKGTRLLDYAAGSKCASAAVERDPFKDNPEHIPPLFQSAFLAASAKFEEHHGLLPDWEECMVTTAVTTFEVIVEIVEAP